MLVMAVVMVDLEVQQLLGAAAVVEPVDILVVVDPLILPVVMVDLAVAVAAALVALARL